YRDFAGIRARDLERELEAGYPRSEFKRRLEEGGEIRGFEAIWKTHKGEAIYVREHARCIRHADGRVKYYEGTVEDITEKRRAEEQLKESEMRYRVFVEQSTE